MVKRYYCDFCDRAYPYSVDAFRKHRNGHQHQKLRRAHYDQFKSARERLEDETKREKCRRFFSGQTCSFGDTCVFSHLTQAGSQELQQQAWEEEEEERRMQLPTPIREGREVSVEAWLKQRDTLPIMPSLVPDTLPGPSSTTRDPASHLTAGPVLMSTSSSSLLSSLPSLPQSLPPSLFPPTMESLLGVEFAKWG
ncbi:zinc finger matrin-type protein 5-like [Eriocheir sinensis]|uniref:zinc finger matrin-type protein 5-like n=1 Tax=Eriocheir sinensis TaxID=95602 RepID=UPI0021C8BBE6|nr:zinc finger matrin-type protein 5-like [Eriocheir sinensis]XP_050696535.1 zinc finger matrin-type protein 5-like [Eriocheir sinensis]XP_050696536.1 zinc finger matrin-type protein 5-like [Eriocheir sinensis]